ncbi:hypothetical protein C8Q76DRAFT_798716 [Earliella scabrosa]|nr:hypothetical protein C8Q76DRAFT_798716 [Earliella scabrosa]
MPRLPEAKELPPSSFSEPSEPSDFRPEDKPAATLRGPQEENPQLIAHMRGRQSGDAKGTNSAGHGGGGGRGPRGDVDEQKRNDVAGGFGVGGGKSGDRRSKL